MCICKSKRFPIEYSTKNHLEHSDRFEVSGEKLISVKIIE